MNMEVPFYLFSFCVFNDASNTHYTASNNLMIPHKEFEEMQKQVIVDQNQVLAPRLPDAEKNNEKLKSG